jgi:hypothetical protein
MFLLIGKSQPRTDAQRNYDSRLSELALVLVRLDHVASIIVNANDCIVRAAVKLRVADCIADRVWLAISQPTESQHIAWLGLFSRMRVRLVERLIDKVLSFARDRRSLARICDLTLFDDGR